MMNLFKDEGVVYQEDEIWKNQKNMEWHDYPIRIEGIIEERISNLEDSLMEILSHASVQGPNFILQVLSRTLNESERNLLMSLSKNYRNSIISLWKEIAYGPENSLYLNSISLIIYSNNTFIKNLA